MHAQDVGNAVRHEQRVAWVGDPPGQAVSQTKATLGGGQHMTRPSEVSRPPSRAAVTFLRPAAGNASGATVSSDRWVGSAWSCKWMAPTPDP